MFATIIQHDSHDDASVFLSETSQEDAEAKAVAFLLEETAPYREEGVTDEDWLDHCLLDGGWSLTTGTIRT